jgi:hypothetical protein
MKAHIKLGRVFGITIGLHYSWIMIALLVTLSLRSQFAVSHPEWDGIDKLGERNHHRTIVLRVHSAA